MIVNGVWSILFQSPSGISVSCTKGARARPGWFRVLGFGCRDPVVVLVVAVAVAGTPEPGKPDPSSAIGSGSPVPACPGFRVRVSGSFRVAVPGPGFRVGGGGGVRATGDEKSDIMSHSRDNKAILLQNMPISILRRT